MELLLAWFSTMRAHPPAGLVTAQTPASPSRAAESAAGVRDQRREGTQMTCKILLLIP